ncbi:MAG: hypothetical protein GEV03_17290 [Streptosporangiales bacterium]|nr:hypothetical protein [Streptosporangiales bacterium]
MAVQEEFATELRSRWLPAVPYRDLPEPPTSARKVVGASIIISAVAIGSGETVLWPNITYQVGLVLMWAAVIGFLTQYFINMEIERYTLATGETAVTGFTRLWKWWGPLFIIMAFIPNVWPGWGTGAATMLTFILGGGSVTLLAIAALVAIGIALTLSPVVYQTVEKVQFVLVALIVAFLVVAVILGTSASDWGDFALSFSNIGRFPPFAAVGGVAALMGAIAYAGAGGASNLAQSNWIRDKGMAMGAYIPRVVSPITGEEVAAPGTGYMFRETDENVARWRRWWKLASREHFITFFVIGCSTLIIMCLLVYATVYGTELPSDEDFAFLRQEGLILGEQVGSWFTIAFWAAIMAALFSTELGVVDWVSRFIADSIKVNVFRDNDAVTESRLYTGMVWLIVVVGSAILLSGMNEPLVLLILGAVLNGFVMFVYSILLIVVNRGSLPRSIRLSGFRFAAMIWACLFYGVFAALVIASEVFGVV